MLLHEWLHYRDRRIRKLQAQAEEAEEIARTAEEELGETEEVAAAAEVEPQAQEWAAEEESPQPEAQPAEMDEIEQVVVVEGDEEEAAGEPVEQPIRPARRSAPRKSPATRAAEAKSARELLETLQPSQEMRQRLEAVLARQQRLPLEQVDEERRPRKRRAAETREQLVARLLDPTLTLQETALLLGVCPTTVRRYTNRGILKCFRTPGNQRRFKLSDVLEFMERREEGEM